MGRYSESSSGSSISSDYSDVSSLGSIGTIGPTLRRGRKNTKLRDRNGCDILVIVVSCTLGFGVLALALELAAYKADFDWNLIVTGDADFPSIENENYFRGKMLNLESNIDPGLETVATLILRANDQETVAIAFMTIYLCTTVTFLILYTQGEGNRNTLSTLNMVGGFIMFISAILIIMSDLTADGNHKIAADELYRIYLQEQTNPPVNLSSANREMMFHQFQTFIQIQDICALSESRGGGRYGWGHKYIYINERDYTLTELRELGFCSYEYLKFASFIICLLYSIMCFGIPCFICYQDRRLQSMSRSLPMDKKKQSAPGFGIGKVPPALGYGYPPGGAQRSSFDPRFAPLPPRQDLAIMLDVDETGKKRMSKASKEINDDDFDASYDSFEPMMFASLQNVPKKDRRSNESGKGPVRPASAPAPKRTSKDKPQAPRKLSDLSFESDASDFGGQKAKANRTPNIPELPEVPKNKRESKKGDNVYQSPYIVRKMPESETD